MLINHYVLGTANDVQGTILVILFFCCPVSLFLLLIVPTVCIFKAHLQKILLLNLVPLESSYTAFLDKQLILLTKK